MLTALNATFEMSLLGFALAVLYYTAFTRRLHTRFDSTALGVVLRSKTAQTLAMPGLIIFMVVAPLIAMRGVENASAIIKQFELIDLHRQVVMGLWLETSIIAGCMVEYALQRGFRALPRFRFDP